MTAIILKCECGESVIFWSSIGWCSCGRVLMIIDSSHPEKVKVITVPPEIEYQD